MRSDRARRWALVVAVLLVATIVAIRFTPDIVNGQYGVSIGDGLQPQLSAADAVAISRAYLDEQRPELAVPDMHKDPHIQQVWAVSAASARQLDGCIPAQTSTTTVWVTRGTGDYLNLRDHPWSHAAQQTNDPVALACEGPGPTGFIVIDDRSGLVLGVYPIIGDQFPHPSPAPH